MHLKMRCAGCQAELPPLAHGERLPRLASCPKCHAELHACRQCKSYDAHLRLCRNPHVDEMPLNHENANFCDYYAPGEPPVPSPKGTSALDDLFGTP